MSPEILSFNVAFMCVRKNQSLAFEMIASAEANLLYLSPHYINLLDVNIIGE